MRRLMKRNKAVTQPVDIQPTPIFDSINFVKEQNLSDPYAEQPFSILDFKQAKSFLLSYSNNQATFNAYRRETEKLLHWTWLIAKKSVVDLNREDIEAYIAFCQNPLHSWVSIKKSPRFIEKDGQRIANPEWRPFVSTVSKTAHHNGKQPSIKKHSLSQKTIQEIFTITSSFYSFLIREQYTETNPINHIRQKSHFITKVQGGAKIRRLTELQWHYVIETAELMADENSQKHERMLFMLTALYAMYLRISELASNARWTPKMGDFYCDYDGLWWFTTIGKGNKQRQISVSDSMLAALRRYRKHLHLTPLPSHGDAAPLIAKALGNGPITSITHIRNIIQSCFDRAIARLQLDGFSDDADALQQATVHWLRHTGISDDVKTRPREHVRDDAGHSSSAITDKYIDIELRERHASARNKSVKQT